jgi:hypothetical protein
MTMSYFVVLVSKGAYSSTPTNIRGFLALLW